MPQCVLSAAVAAALTLGITLALLVGATLVLLSEGDDPRAALALPRTFCRRGPAPGAPAARVSAVTRRAPGRPAHGARHRNPGRRGRRRYQAL